MSHTVSALKWATSSDRRALAGRVYRVYVDRDLDGDYDRKATFKTDE